MADKITVTKELKLGAKFVDGDTRTLTLDNPKDNITATQINAVGAVIKSSNILLGDKTGADFLEFDTAKTCEKEKIDLDLR